MRIAGAFQVVNSQNVIQGRPEDQPNAPLGSIPSALATPSYCARRRSSGWESTRGGVNPTTPQ